MDSKNISGYDLALRVLSHERGGVEALLSLSGNDESCWLELKAGMALLPEDEKRGGKPDDLYWKIAKAVISLMNTSGGVVLIGIEDKTHAAIPLRSNDPRHVIEKDGLEAYRRKEIFERIWPDGKSWKYRNENWTIEDAVPENLIEVKGVKYRGEDIAAILVNPAPTCVRVWKNGEVEQILVREPGELGKGKSIIGSRKMEEYERTRHIETEFLKSLYEKFLAQVETASEAATVNLRIADYYAGFEQDVKARRGETLSCFTPLDASGGAEVKAPYDGFMSSQEEVTYFDDDDWSDPGEEVPDYKDVKRVADGKDDEKNACAQEVRFGDLLTLMREIPRMWLLGEPGGGKTTALIHFTMQFNGETPDKPVLAVFIPMGQWGKGGSVELMLEKITGLSPAQWSTLIGEGRLRLIIDAVNECPDQFRPAAVWAIRQFLLKYPKLPAVISARTDENLKTLRLPVFAIQPMDDAHQRCYLSNYLKDQMRADEILRCLKKLPGGEEIATNPMLLRLVIEVVRDGGTLPAGRASLYRQWLRQWYRRESRKAQSAEAPLPWNFDTALNILAELAMRGRLHGYRDIPLEFAKNMLSEYGPECLEKLCQGPVVIVDNDFIRFRHETFQEYLCAEYLLRDPDALSTLAELDYARWGMPVAYASELCGNLPEPLLRAAWRMNSWFGCALAGDPGRLDMSSATGVMPTAPREFFERLLPDGQAGGIKLPPNGWYSRDDRTLAYLVAANPRSMSCWRRLELCRLCRVPKVCEALCDTIALKNDADAFSWDASKGHVMDLAHEERAADAALEKLNGSFEGPDSRFRAVQLVKNGWADEKDFLGWSKNWAEYPMVRSLPRDMDIKGIGGRRTFTEHSESNCGSKTDAPVCGAAVAGLAGPAIIGAFLGGAAFLVGPLAAKFLTAKKHSDTERIADSGVSETTDISDLAGLSRTSKEGLAERFSRWMKKASMPVLAKSFFDFGLVTKEELAGERVEWVRSASTPGEAKRFIDLGLATKEDFADRIPGWIKDVDTPEVAKRFIDLGWATRGDFADRIPGWIKDVDTPGPAKRFIDLGWATKGDFADRIPKWIAEATGKTAQRLISSGFATQDDFADKTDYEK